MAKNFDAFFGTAEVRALQMAQDRQVDTLRETSGAVVHARTFSADDPERLGWDVLRQRMAQDKRITLRGVSENVVKKALTELADFNPVLHRWDIFLADDDALRTACQPLTQNPLPPGLHRTANEAIDDNFIHEVQSFLTEHGVSPFSKDALAGRLFPAQLVVLHDDTKNIVATGFAAMTHNQFSPFEGVAWVGLIAVAPSWRGKELGKYVDALSNLVAVDELGATATMEFVAQDNIPSRRMLEACGLRQSDNRTVAMLSMSQDRMTR
ncbi:MAG: GNAT family N-acetyltransferase [Marinosulfonomonas sp.]|nr:GNAT family N-acetyltransferase [Marinosulfonomonas sp.]